ncbi:V-type sodium ATPase subunit D [archaeon HR06]|nr:V-type sodium ATPase subunit D [archaeon HR06]
MSVSFGKQVLPTKIELIRLRRSLKVARMVYKILEDKREVLLKRLDEIIDQAYETREKLYTSLLEAYNSLYEAYLSLGSLRLESIALTTPNSVDVKVNVRSIVDVQVPTLEIEQKRLELTYGFFDTDPTLDKASKMLRDTLFKICKAAEVENSIFRLAKELEKTQRLINALEYVIIPQYEGAIRYISSVLEEREREEFVRLKQVKKVLEKRKGG